MYNTTHYIYIQHIFIQHIYIQHIYIQHIYIQHIYIPHIYIQHMLFQKGHTYIHVRTTHTVMLKYTSLQDRKGFPREYTFVDILHISFM